MKTVLIIDDLPRFHREALLCKSSDESDALFCLSAGSQFAEEGGAPEEFMFMPAGSHAINATRAGKPISKTVIVDRNAATALQAQLDAVKARSGQKPYFDFNHDDAEASAWPLSFSWKDGAAPGVYCRVAWSKAGSEAISGKSYRAFSPVFHVDKATPARVACRTDADLNFGGLVNDPAFKAILPLWAKNAGAQTPGENQNQKQNIMTPEELAALRAKQKELENDILALKAKAGTENADALKAKQTEHDLAKAKIEAAEKDTKIIQLETEIKAKRTKDAKAMVDAAVGRGVIPPKDDALKAKWQKLLEEDPENESLLAGQAAPSALGESRITAKGVIITREDSVAVLNAYGAERDPKKRAAIYAKQIRPRLAEGDDMPLMAANSVGTLAGTLVAQRTMELFKLQFPILSRISTDFSDQPANFNQQVVSRIISIPTVQTYDAAAGWAAADATTTDVPVTINNHKGVPLTFDSNTLASTVRRLFDEQAPAASYALAKVVVDALYALITVGNFTNAPTVCAQIDFNRQILTLIAALLNPLGAPLMGRFVLLNSPYYQQLGNDTSLVYFAATQTPGMVTESKLPKLAGFDPIEAPNLPATNNLVGFAGVPSTLVVATRLPNDYTTALPGSSYGSVTTITDPDTGMSVMLTQYVDHKLGAATWRISVMFGVAKGEVAGGVVIKSA